MGVIAKQSGWASVAIGAGLVLGAVNTMVVLPRAFEGAEAQWGLIRILTSWGMILSSLAVLGVPSAIMRFLSRFPSEERPGILKTMLLIPAGGLAIMLSVMLVAGDRILPLMDAERGKLLSQHLFGFMAITTSMCCLHIIRAIVNQQLKSAIIAWVDEFWQKGSYLILGVLLLNRIIDFQLFLWGYIASWGISSVILFVQALQMPLRVAGKYRWDQWKSIVNFSSFSVLAGAAAIIATHLDYVMIGMFLGLAEVPIYTIGYFVGSVVGMPGRATQNILGAVTADKIHSPKKIELKALNRASARVNFLLSASIMAGIWAGFQPFEMILPAGYRGIEAIFICIGLHRLITSFNLVNNQILGYSDAYRIVLPLNLGLVLVTVVTNYLFLVVFEWGLLGAALATLGTAIWNNTWRLWIVWRRFQTHPFSWHLLLISAISIVSAYSFHWPVGTMGHPIVGAISQGLLASTTTFGLCYVLGCFPELREGLKRQLSWWP